MTDIVCPNSACVSPWQWCVCARVHVLCCRPRYVAGVFLMAAYSFQIPPDQEAYHVDINCVYQQPFSMFPFAYRTHAHNLGSVITGYQHNTSGYHLIGKGNPQWPQAFYPTNTSVEVKPGDILVARCTYNSIGMDHSVSDGSTGNDEMCNFYMMFYTDASVAMPSGACGGVRFPSMVNSLPAGSDVTLPPQPLLEAWAHGHHHHHHHHTKPSVAAPTSTDSPAEESLTGQLEFQSDWPTDDLSIGQVGGVATDSSGNVYIFHRGDRKWTAMSFDKADNFLLKDQPIQQDTVLILSSDGRLIRKFGMGRYFMPHGIEVDHDGNIWLTDVALHQVFRISAGGTVANLILGERFVNGDDSDHFCKPADVAVLKSGEFFVSDGYCNSRILKFSKDGQLLKQWGQGNVFGQEPGPGQFFIPHSITVAPRLNLVCVADRENGRVQCFDLQGGFQFQIKHPQFGAAVYAIDFCPRHGGLLFAVNGLGSSDVKGFTFRLSNQTLLETWNLPSPQSLATPHGVAVDGDCHAVYVGELDPAAVRKFTRCPHGNGSLQAEGPEQLTDSTWVLVVIVAPFVAVMVGLLMTVIIASYCREWQGGIKPTITSRGVKKSKWLRNSRKGFDPLLQDASDDSDSENDIFLQPDIKAE